MFFASDRVGWVVTAGGLLHTQDGGGHWSELPVPVTFTEVEFIDGSLGFGTDGQQLYRTQDGGATWSSENLRGERLTLQTDTVSERAWALDAGRVWRRSSPVRFAGAGGKRCAWLGEWATKASGEPMLLTLFPAEEGSRSKLRGLYAADGRRVVARAEGNTLAGAWTAPPSHAGPEHAGRFRLELSVNCTSFAGHWGFGQSDTDGGTWVGARYKLPVIGAREAMVATAYRATLARDVEPEGLQYWRDTGLPQDQIEACLRHSEEGARVHEVRAAYQELLGRDPLWADPAGLRGWVATGLTRGDLVEAIRASAEFRDRETD
ncbi:MAG: hypothetical protein EXR52_01100 [Dehalococcoidia bacterium]|nr:hypothetical protein [Dehalococcoidia bacterium]